jgi:hypothetical protein
MRQPRSRIIKQHLTCVTKMSRLIDADRSTALMDSKTIDTKTAAVREWLLRYLYDKPRGVTGDTLRKKISAEMGEDWSEVVHEALRTLKKRGLVYGRLYRNHCGNASKGRVFLWVLEKNGDQYANIF